MNEFETNYSMYKHAVESITMCFAHKYFGEYYQYNKSDWVGLEIGGVICINDYWFNVDDMISFMKYKYTKNEMFAYYDYALEVSDDKRSTWKKIYMLIMNEYHNTSPVCIRDWKKLKKKV
jgi:hypothetical protein